MYRYFKKKGFTLVELLVVIAVISLLSSIILASLNTARKKSRDARRIADIKQLQLAEELYSHTNNGVYTPALTDLAPTYIPVLPADPLSAAYTYERCGSTVYHIGAALEESTNVALNNDLNAKPAACTNVWGVDTAVCSGTAGTNQGSYCYDVTN
jgi:prepilin-type N-terminal cleavage/methylation domain-containing protein